MPRISAKARILEYLEHVIRRRMHKARRRFLLGEEDIFEDIKDMLIKNRYLKLQKKRYAVRSNTYRQRTNAFDWDDVLSEDSKTYSNDEFLFVFRMTRQSFSSLHELIKDHHVFNKKGNKKQRPSWQQLMVYLFRVGKESSGGSDMAISSFFRIGYGTVSNYISNVVEAIMSLKPHLLCWHTEAEREAMKIRCGVSKGFHQCVGIIDGTLMFLEKRPTLNGEAYHCRKGGYAINLLVVCDDESKILYLYGGWPGSTHDNRAWRNCRLNTKREEYFGERDYLLGDSAFSKSSIMVQSFKQDAHSGYLDEKKEFFNTKLGSLRIKSEHCIGMLKGRFRCVRRINSTVKCQEDLGKILRLVESVAIVHNFLLKEGEQTIPQSWYEDVNEMLEIEDDGAGDDDYELNGNEDYDRREAVFRSIIEQFWHA